MTEIVSSSSSEEVSELTDLKKRTPLDIFTVELWDDKYLEDVLTMFDFRKRTRENMAKMLQLDWISRYVAVSDGKAVGHIGVADRTGFINMPDYLLAAGVEDPHRIGYIGRLVVDEGLRQKGIADQLVERALMSCAAHGRVPIAEVHADNMVSRRLFQKHGFTIRHSFVAKKSRQQFVIAVHDMLF